MQNSEGMFSGYKKPFTKMGTGIEGLMKLCEGMGGEFYRDEPGMGIKRRGKCLLREINTWINVEENNIGLFSASVDNGLMRVDTMYAHDYDELVAKRFPFSNNGGIIELKADHEIRQLIVCHNDKNEMPTCSVTLFEPGYSAILPEP